VKLRTSGFALEFLLPALVLPAFLLLSGCQKGPTLQGKVDGLKQLADAAEKSGAKKCAPRELALARAYLEFAELDLERGKLREAERWVSLATVHAKAAELESPREICVVQPDRDGDGIVDPLDKCVSDPESYNGFVDEDGCPDDLDSDGDQITDANDSCPVDAEDTDQFEDQDGCPELDNDVDTVRDAQDACPNDGEDPDGYEDQDGCPDPDNDRDDVPDLTDACPSTPGQKEGEPLGCPLKPALVIVTDCEVKITQQIHFAYNKDIIKSESFPILDAVTDVLVKNPSFKIEVQGHTDDKGSDSYNQELSNRRAHSVRKYLVAHGIGPDRLTARGYGESVPLVANDSNENRSLNRRVQFVRTEGQKEGCGGAAQSSVEKAKP
jgi:OmpA-OmpF porin, OOP family